MVYTQNSIMDYTQLLKEKSIKLPLAFVDLDAFDRNLAKLAAPYKNSPLSIRIATKSIRIPQLIKRALDFGAPYQGLMCYAAEEALFLAQQGFDDFLIAYPTVQESDLLALRKLHEMGAQVTLVVDCEEHLRKLADAMERVSRPFQFIIEYDTSLRLPGVVVGVRRSPVRSPQVAIELIKLAEKEWPQLKFGGFMAYEAQVAGLGDRNPFKKLLNPVFGLVRRISFAVIKKRRLELKNQCEKNGIQIPLFNGGGTGSLSFNLDEVHTLTEVTAGSGFFCPHLFDYYSNLSLEPSAFFALQASRRPDSKWLTCLGGGYIASGEPGWDRVPRPHDVNLTLSGVEGCGEVQTPVQGKAHLDQMPLGTPIVFRHAKAGELMERFQEVHLIANARWAGKSPTYRGLGQCYF